MFLKELSCEVLEKKFDALKVVDRVEIKVSELQKDLKNKFEELLGQPKWPLSTFFFLIAAFHFVNDFLHIGYIDSQYLPNTTNDGLLYRRTSLLFCDVDEVKNKFVKYCQENYPYFLKFAKALGIDEVDVVEPIKLLEIIEANSQFGVKKTIAGRPSGTTTFVLPEISRNIRCAYHGADIQLAEKGISCTNFTTYNMKQMVELLVLIINVVFQERTLLANF